MAAERTTGSITAANSANVIHTMRRASGEHDKDTSAMVGTSGTYAGVTVEFKGKFPGGSVAYPLNGVNLGTGQPTLGTTVTLATNGTAAFLVWAAGMETVEVDTTGWTSGTCAVEIVYNDLFDAPPFEIGMNKALS